ncbi:MAG: amino acid ABC transporter substrate-binding protein [bacterium]|nr:amino acid ABC transporter substrate-binding protein [bacterium]
MKTQAILVGLLCLGLSTAASAQEPTEPPEKDRTYGDTPQVYEPYARFTEPYERFFLTPLEYRGWGRHLPEPEDLETVKIGFLGPIEPTVSVATGGASHEEHLGRMMLRGAQLAIEHANQRGGYRPRNIPFELVVRNDNGLWGASGSEIVHLAYEEKVWAILGTIDGANSHIAIRVAFKIEIPVINTGDTDPTFVETSIPWVFRNITDDRQMSYLLADYLFGELGVKRIAALRSNNRYGRIGIDELRDASTRLGFPFLAELNYQVGDTDFEAQLHRLQSLDPEVIVTWGDARESALILKQMRSLGMKALLVGSDRMVSQEFLDLAGTDAEGAISVSPWDPTHESTSLQTFEDKFEARFGESPETYAAHAYDGITMLVEAIEKAGLNRALIRDELARIKQWDGVTGSKVFDDVYSNRSPASLVIVKAGAFVFIDPTGLSEVTARQAEPAHQ